MTSPLLLGAISSVSIAVPSLCDIWNAIKNLFSKYTVIGLSIPIGGGKSYLLKHLQSDQTILIDLDQAVGGVNKTDNSSLGIDRDFYTKAKSVYADILEITQGVSKSAKTIIFLSRDYTLLKYLTIGKVYYFLGSASYYDSLKLSDVDSKILQAYKDKLNAKSKMSKTIVYNTKEELMAIISSMFGTQQKV